MWNFSDNIFFDLVDMKIFKKPKIQNRLRQFDREAYQKPQNHKRIRILYTVLAGYLKKVIHN